MAQYKNGPMGKWVKRIQQLLPNIGWTLLSGSAARNLGGKEVLTHLFVSASHGLDDRIQKEILSHLESYSFPFSDFDLHFTLPLGSNAFETLNSAKETILSNLPTDVNVIGEPIIRVNLKDDRYQEDDPRRFKTFLKIELKGPDGQFDMVFEPEGQYATLFGADDLVAILNDDESAVQFYSSDPYSYCENQIFRTLTRKIIPDNSYHRRILLSMTRGYHATQELINECKEAAAKITPEKRKFLADVTIKSHFSGQNIAQWIYRLGHQMAWGDIPEEMFPDGHIITETLNATLRIPPILPKAHALIQFIGLIALLEDHQGEHRASIRDGKLALEFPGGYTLWMPFDPVKTLQELNLISQAELEELKKVLKCMPGWIPRGKVKADYFRSVESCFKLSDLYTILNSKPCELLQLRLQSALSGTSCSQNFWKNALDDTNIQISFLYEKLRKRNMNFTDEDLVVLEESMDTQLCRRIADRLLEDKNERAIDYLKLLETNPNINWEPICKAIKDKKALECLQLQKLIAAGIQAVPEKELPSLLNEVKEKSVLIRLAEELLSHASPSLFQLGVRLLENEDGYAERIAQRAHDLDEEHIVRFAVEKKIPLTEELMERLLSPTVELKTQVILMQRYKGPNSERLWKLIATSLTYVQGSWPATWPQIPELNPRAQTLWTGVVELINQKEYEKAKNAIATLLKGEINPPGGRVAFQTWLLIIGEGKKFAPLFGQGDKVENLFEKDPEAFCATVMCQPGTVAIGSKKFISTVVEFHLDSKKDPWPIYEKLGKKSIDDSIRCRWISQAPASQMCQLLPTHQPGTPFLPHLKRAEVIEELSSTPSLHPWVYELLLDGPPVDWPNELLMRVCGRLIQHEHNPRKISLIAVYGQRLPEYKTIWERVAFNDPGQALSFTAVWLKQGIPPVCIKQLHLTVSKPHSSVEEFFHSCMNQGHDALAVELWKKINLFKQKKFLSLAKQLFMRVEDLDLAKWFLKNSPPEMALFLRALALPFDHAFATQVLCPALLSFKGFNKKEPEINQRLIPLLKSEDFTIDLVNRLCLSTDLDPSTGRKLAEICFSKVPENPEWLNVCWFIIKNLQKDHGVWEEETWSKIFNLLTRKLKFSQKNMETFDRDVKQYDQYLTVFESIFSDNFAKETLSNDQYWLLLRCYTLIIEKAEAKPHCRTLWEDAINTFPKARRVVGIPELTNLESCSTIASIIASMEENDWIDSEYANVLRFLSLSVTNLVTQSCDEQGVEIIKQHCLLLEQVHPKIDKYLHTLYERFSIENIEKMDATGLGSLQHLPRIALKGIGQNEIHAKQIVATLHEAVSKLAKSNLRWGELFLPLEYCYILLRSQQTLPHWWIEELVDLFIQHPNLISHKKEDLLINNLQLCAIACGPEPDRDPHLPNKAMKKLHAFVNTCLDKVILDFDPFTHAKVISLAGGNFSEISPLLPEHLKGIKEAILDITIYTRRMPHLWKWNLILLNQTLLNFSRENIVIPCEFIRDYCATIGKLIQENSPENEREAILDSHLHFLMSEELKPLFTPPKDAKKFHTLEKEYKTTRVNCVYSYLYELCTWGPGIKPKITNWVGALVNESFFEFKVMESFKKRWKQLK
jgi:hypothetical protein